MDLKSLIRTVPDYPKPGILFRDISTLLYNGKALKYITEIYYNRYKDKGLNGIAAIEARGFIFGAILAEKLEIAFIPIRKKGKLPHNIISQEYDLEYGKATIEVHVDAINKNDNVLIVDDLIATGGTALASIKLIKKLGANIIGCTFIIDLPSLEGRKKIEAMGIEVQTLCSFDGH